MCLIRDDLTTLWCEVTSSIRSRVIKEDDDGVEVSGGQASSSVRKSGLAEPLPSCSSLNSSKGSKIAQLSFVDTSPPQKVTKELLLCLRPIRDGEEKVDESFRFIPAATKTVEGAPVTESDSGTMTGESNVRSSSASNSTYNDADSGGSTENSGTAAMTKVTKKSRPPKKRPLLSKVSIEGDSAPTKKSRLSSDAEKSVVESLILMSNNPSTP